MASDVTRVLLKVAISFAATGFCFVAIEQPARLYLNAPNRRWLAFASLAASLLVLIPAGTYIRRTYYVNAEQGSVAGGGILFNAGGRNGSMILMGDSNGSMYGRMATEVAADLDLKLRIISVAAGDALPSMTGEHPPLWRDSFSVIQRERPDVLLYVCLWTKLESEPERLGVAIESLRKLARRVILITQPPQMPESASRAAIRNGNRPPFFENPASRGSRAEINRFVKSFEEGNVEVVDVESVFSDEAGAVRVLDERGRPLYHDPTHLSATGARLVAPRVGDAIRRPQ